MNVELIIRFEIFCDLKNMSEKFELESGGVKSIRLKNISGGVLLSGNCRS